MPPQCEPKPFPPNNLSTFDFWCQKVLPLVYDDSLSYYEVLCKVVDYLNKVIQDENAVIARQEALRKELAIVQKWIADYDTDFTDALIERHLATMVMFGLTDDGYLVAYVPESWKTINFATTGYDIHVHPGVEFGRLTLIY